ncbi:hypothetical protein AOQ84DRAFT_405427 [Glonium stellatum]|uniref:Rhodopsin domain-containing protein n=1 Tax=Glonium stellatum TaxID=574774 RepID=A0A8E2JYN3_9PEZI|nr:hypothetical protein AOQ84DRAFT_405427 [Glonium stellatum]
MLHTIPAHVMVGVVMTLFSFSTALVGLRLTIRIFIFHSAGLDDWTCFAAWMLNLAETVLLFQELSAGSGQHVALLSPEQVQQALLMEYISILPYIWCIGFVKASIVIQLQRTLPTHNNMRKLCIFMSITIGIVTAAFTVVFLLMCMPPNGYWDLSKRAECHAIWTTNFAFLAVNVATEVALILMPIVIFGKLQLRKADKLGLIAIFTLFGLVPITNLLRIPAIIYMEQDPDMTYSHQTVVGYSRIELNVCIICACLPTLRVPLARAWSIIRRQSQNNTTLHQVPREGVMVLNRVGPSSNMASLED